MTTFVLGDAGVTQIDNEIVTRAAPNDVAVIQGGSVSELRAGPAVESVEVTPGVVPAPTQFT